MRLYYQLVTKAYLLDFSIEYSQIYCKPETFTLIVVHGPGIDPGRYGCTTSSTTLILVMVSPSTNVLNFCTNVSNFFSASMLVVMPTPSVYFDFLILPLGLHILCLLATASSIRPRDEQ